MTKIYYFSGTGNSKWIAESLAKKLEGKAYDIIGDVSAESMAGIDVKDTVGIVFPVYAWRAPEVMQKFVEKFSKEISKAEFIFTVISCGDEVGESLKYLRKLIPVHSGYSIKMPNNYIVLADVDSEETARAKIENAKLEIAKIAAEVANKNKVERLHKGGLSRLKSSLANWGFNNFARGTSAFYVTEKCTGCGLCAEVCPAKIIKMKDSKPIWDKGCYQCVACINRCPEQAIQYG
ncbi:MAG: EFR1 family ferrodoxin, partial [Anaerovoracaceae bacterium]